MKKTIRLFAVILAIASMLCAITVSAAPAFEFDENPNCIWSQSVYVGYQYSGFKDRVEDGSVLYSNNEAILEVATDGTIIAKSEGYAVIAELMDGELLYYYGFNVSAPQNTMYGGFSEAVQEQRDLLNAVREKQEKTISFVEIIVPILIVAIILLVLAEIIYIFVTAPKFGMSRLWAIAPIIGNVFGLFVFLILKTMAKQNTMATTNVVTCSICNGRHPYGTSVCPICGTRLG